ncbi:Transcriptional enhancer factor TEF-1 [Trichinella zimbabwensis]|uniref:Transcriptional enhancer factor TEF-1 n=2 Tax=Trichinella zimbabwensis TaxID=268475 RepID=A0A0V1HE83_9BILA|nr:Transcriptional enhancer factor TEF-1 [Trichinella zimbabwensis]
MLEIDCAQTTTTITTTIIIIILHQRRHKELVGRVDFMNAALVKADGRATKRDNALYASATAVDVDSTVIVESKMSAAESSDWSTSHSSPLSNGSQGSGHSGITVATVNGNGSRDPIISTTAGISNSTDGNGNTNNNNSNNNNNNNNNNGGSVGLPDSISPAATDAEGVWSPDIEQSFQEALAIYPPCGRRKIILSEEGKMYGRNELIARYIKLRTGKTRTRKQVSSHIQVLARKKARELSAKLKEHGAKEKALNNLSNMSSAQIVSMSPMHSKITAAGLTGLYGAAPSFWQPGFSPPPSTTLANPLGSVASPGDVADVKPFSPMNPTAAAAAAAAAAVNYSFQRPTAVSLAGYSPGSLSLTAQHALTPVWEGRTVCSPRIRLCDFSAYCLPNPADPTRRHELVRISSAVTHADPLLEAIDISQVFDKFPSGKTGLRELYERGPQNAFFLVKFWADVSFNVPDEQAALFAVDSRYESNETMTISVSTKVCSFGKQVVEKVEHEYPKFEKGRLVYRITRSPMCEYMNNFIHKLKKLPERYMMNSVLENFTILQLVTTKETQETLLCIAFVFEISDGDGSQHRVYRLTHTTK